MTKDQAPSVILLFSLLPFTDFLHLLLIFIPLVPVCKSSFFHSSSSSPSNFSLATLLVPSYKNLLCFCSQPNPFTSPSLPFLSLSFPSLSFSFPFPSLFPSSIFLPFHLPFLPLPPLINSCPSCSPFPPSVPPFLPLFPLAYHTSSFTANQLLLLSLF